MESFLPCDLTSLQKPHFLLFCNLQLRGASELSQLNVSTEHPELTRLPLSCQKAPLEKGNTGERTLNYCVLHNTGNSISANTEVPRSATHLTSLLPLLCIWAQQHIHLRHSILPFQLFFFPNSSCLICYIIKLCCNWGKCTSRFLLSWINTNAKANSAGTLPLPWSHLSW